MPRKITTDEFVKRAREAHGDRYDYSLVDYKNMNTKIKIICKRHGIFEQLPADHKEHGCSACGYEDRKTNKRT